MFKIGGARMHTYSQVSPPATSPGRERVFSKAGNMHYDHKKRTTKDLLSETYLLDQTLSCDVCDSCIPELLSSLSFSLLPYVSIRVKCIETLNAFAL